MTRSVVLEPAAAEPPGGGPGAEVKSGHMTEDMTQVDGITLEDIDPQQVIAIRKTVPMGQVGDFIGPTIGKLFGVAADAGLQTTGSSMALSYDVPTDTIDIAPAVAVKDDGATITCKLPPGVEVLTLPGGKAATLKYVGDYSGLPAQYQKLGSWVQEQGLKPRYAPWEEYLCAPGCSEDQPCEYCQNGPVTVIHWPVN